MCFSLLWVVQVANVALVFVDVFVGVTNFSLFLLLLKLFQSFWVVQMFSNRFSFLCALWMFYVVFRCLVCFSFLICSGLCSVVFGRLKSVSCLGSFMFVLLSYIFSLFTSFQVVFEIYVVIGRSGVS